MKVENFKDLRVWEKSHCLVLEIYKITKLFPRDEKFGLVAQIRRSATSICANIAEGYMKSTKDFIRFLDISRGSLEETKYHLILSKDLNYVSSAQFDDLYNLSDEVGKMMYCLRKSL